MTAADRYVTSSIYDGAPSDRSSVEDCTFWGYSPKRTAPLMWYSGRYVHLRQVTITDASTPVELIHLGVRALLWQTRHRVRRAYRKALWLHIEREAS